MKKTTLARILFHTFFVFVFFVGAFSIPSHSHAATDINIQIDNPLTSNTIQGFIANVLSGITVLLTPVIVVMFLWTGFLFVKAQGNAEELKKARESLTYVLIGAAIALGAKAFAMVISSTLSQL